MKYLFRGKKGSYYYGNLVIRSGNAFIVNDKEDIPVILSSISLASPFCYLNGDRIFEHDHVSYYEESGIVQFENGEFSVKFDNTEISLSEIYMYLEREHEIN